MSNARVCMDERAAVDPVYNWSLSSNVKPALAEIAKPAIAGEVEAHGVPAWDV